MVSVPGLLTYAGRISKSTFIAALTLLMSWFSVQHVVTGFPNHGLATDKSSSTCDFFGTSHRVGEVWHTKSEFEKAPSSGGCMTCECHQGGLMECKHTPYAYNSPDCRQQCQSNSYHTTPPDYTNFVNPKMSSPITEHSSSPDLGELMSQSFISEERTKAADRCCPPCDVYKNVTSKNSVEFENMKTYNLPDQKKNRQQDGTTKAAITDETSTHHTHRKLKRRRKAANPVAVPLSHQLSLESDDQQRRPRSSEHCTHEGKIYSAGESLIMTSGGGSSSKQTPAPAASSNKASSQQCFQCRCSHGRLWCHPETCPPLKCKNSIRIANSCCPICRDDAPAEDASISQAQDKLSEGSHPLETPPAAGSHPERPLLVTTPSLISVAPTAPSPNSEDCYSGGRQFRHGSKWHPVIGPFGEMECVLCGCDTGQISCHRLSCPSAEELGCKTELVKVPGRCCASCLDENDDKAISTNNGRLTTPAVPQALSSSHSSRSRGDRNHLVHSHQQHKTHRKTPQHHCDKENGDGHDGSHGKSAESNEKGKGRPSFAVCSPPGTDVVAYMIADAFQNGTRTITYVFHKKNITKPYSKPVEKHKWTLDKRLHHYESISEEDVEPHKFETFYEGLDNLEALKGDDKLPMTILGSTTAKYLERFTKKEKKLDSRCSRKCHERVRKLEAFLRLRPIHYRRQCHPNEVELS